MNHLLTAQHIAIGYQSGKRCSTVHSDLSFALEAGQLTCLLGANGMGKSTLLRTLAAYQPALGGVIRLQGKPLETFSERELSRTIGVVLTDSTSVGGLTVEELVALGRQPHTGFFGRLRARDRARIEEAMQQVGISDKAHRYVAELSDGERQKAMIAKTLVQECPLILLDEPTAFLDACSRIDIMTLLHRLAAEQGKAILLSTHDIHQALQLSDQLWLLTAEGITTGCTEDIVLSAAIQRLFPEGRIAFDERTGGFLPLTAGQDEITVSAASPTLRHWLLNFLRRNGWRGVIGEQATSATPHIHVE
ncbi:MAG: ABC transporter ATP-binding protein, partial [Bacteroidaceae bacterium]|nr:ABC transporter ATP-binding protein [Bacteroidaceae bacterium]